MFDAAVWPPWTSDLTWTMFTVGLAWLVGRVLTLVLKARVAGGNASDSRTTLDESTRIVARRLPLWGLLLGAWLSLSYWPLTPHAYGWARAPCSRSACCQWHWPSRRSLAGLCRFMGPELPQACR